MKKITLLIILLFLNLSCFAQDTEAPTTPVNLQISNNIFTHPALIDIEWEHATDNVGVTSYEIFINGFLEEIVAYDGSNPTQYVNFGLFNNGTYCLTILAKDAAGNASPLSDQVCKSVSTIDEVEPNKPYLSGLLNYAGDNKAIEISNIENNADLSDYSIKISYDGSGTWDAEYTFPANISLEFSESYVIAHPNSSLCSNVVAEYNSNITNFDGNDAIGLFKYGQLYDIIGDLGNSNTFLSTDAFIKRIIIGNGIPSTNFYIDFWEMTFNDGSCPNLLGVTYLILLDVEDETLNSFNIYPNPIKGNTLQFNTKNNQPVDSATIVDMTGKTVLASASIINNQLNIQNITQGIYFVKIQSGDKVSIHKMIRQ